MLLKLLTCACCSPSDVEATRALERLAADNVQLWEDDVASGRDDRDRERFNVTAEG